MAVASLSSTQRRQPSTSLLATISSSEFLASIRSATIDLGKTTIGQASETGQPIQVPDMTVAYDHPFREFTLDAGFGPC